MERSLAEFRSKQKKIRPDETLAVAPALESGQGEGTARLRGNVVLDKELSLPALIGNELVRIKLARYRGGLA